MSRFGNYAAWIFVYGFFYLILLFKSYTMLNILKALFPKEKSTIERALADGAVIIDVRTPDEFKSGHISGSQNIPLIEIRQKIPFIRGWNKPVITVCLSGGRSAVAKSVLAAAGIEAYNGGGWQEIKDIQL